jgi:hypothetical protein
VHHCARSLLSIIEKHQYIPFKTDIDHIHKELKSEKNSKEIMEPITGKMTENKLQETIISTLVPIQKEEKKIYSFNQIKDELQLIEHQDIP